jgi:hypothetical protein
MTPDLRLDTPHATIYHIRRRLRRSTSTNWRLDTSDRSNGTFCGAPYTEYDATWANRLRAGTWQHPDKGEFAVCAGCAAKAATDLGRRDGL